MWPILRLWRGSYFIPPPPPSQLTQLKEKTRNISIVVFATSLLSALLFQLLKVEMHILKPPTQKACLVRFKKQLFVKSCILSLWRKRAFAKRNSEVHNQKVHVRFINITVEAVLNYQIAHCATTKVLSVLLCYRTNTTNTTIFLSNISKLKHNQIIKIQTQKHNFKINQIITIKAKKEKKKKRQKRLKTKAIWPIWIGLGTKMSNNMKMRAPWNVLEWGRKGKFSYRRESFGIK